MTALTSVRILFGFCFFFSFANFDVWSWTVDLDEVRKYVYDKNNEGNVKKNVQTNYNDNIYIPQSTEDLNDSDVKNYAVGYGYDKDEDDLSYMEKKVHGVVVNGSRYLAGLRRSLDRYSEILENCTRMNFTSLQNVTANSTWRPPIDFPTNEFRNVTLLSNLTLGDRVLACRRATRASERVRQLSKLALKATEELQDIGYAKKYAEHQDYLPEENELILKLAWFLDRLAYYTGYEPDNRAYSTTERPPVTVPPPMTLVNAPDDVKLRMMECLKENSTVPATERCRYPLPLPGLVMQIFNITEDAASSQSSSSSLRRDTVVPLPSENIELLIATDARQFFYPFTYNKENIQSRSVKQYDYRPSPLYTKVDLSNYPPFSSVTGRNIRKRSIENPLLKVVKYYSKYKLWANSNKDLDSGDLTDTTLKNEDFDVTNDLPVKSVNKRSIQEHSVNRMTNDFNRVRTKLDRKYLKDLVLSIKKEKSVQKRSLPIPVIKLPEHPTQDLSHYLKHKPGVNYIKNKGQAEKIREYLKKIRGKLIKRQKRSLTYERKFLPRDSENPVQDLSYYVKNKYGTNLNRDPLQAAQVRVGLERIFQTGNIEVVRRYGSNYNPLVPAPFLAGLILSVSDV